MKKNMQSLQATLMSRREQKALKGGWTYIPVCHTTGEVFFTITQCRKSGRCPDNSCGPECIDCP
jgi:hypothetical protein